MPSGIYLHHKGYHRSKETRKKISDCLKGRHPTEKTKKRMSEGRKGKLSGNKGKRASEETKIRMSNASKGRIPCSKGKHLSKETRLKISKAHKGKLLSTETKIKISKILRKSDAITPVTKLLRTNNKYAEWRQRCFIRDNFTCQKCNQRGLRLEVHHKTSFSILFQEAIGYMPLLSKYDACLLYTPLWDISNGITLCKSCHKLTYNYKIERIKKLNGI